MKGLGQGAGTAQAVYADASLQSGTASTGRRHAVLKSATEAAHAELDAFTMRAGYFDDASRFVAYLHRMAYFHNVYARVTHTSDAHGWRAMWQVDRHGAWIAEDLRTFGGFAGVAPLLTAPSRDANLDPAVEVLTALRPKCTSWLLGSLYVLAGSTLGARMLHKLTVARALPTAAGSSYLMNVGSSMSWQQFLQFMETAAIDSEELMIEGALATFAGVQLSLELI